MLTATASVQNLVQLIKEGRPAADVGLVQFGGSGKVLPEAGASSWDALDMGAAIADSIAYFGFSARTDFAGGFAAADAALAARPSRGTRPVTVVFITDACEGDFDDFVWSPMAGILIVTFCPEIQCCGADRVSWGGADFGGSASKPMIRTSTGPQGEAAALVLEVAPACGGDSQCPHPDDAAAWEPICTSRSVAGDIEPVNAVGCCRPQEADGGPSKEYLFDVSSLSVCIARCDSNPRCRAVEYTPRRRICERYSAFITETNDDPDCSCYSRRLRTVEDCIPPPGLEDCEGPFVEATTAAGDSGACKYPAGTERIDHETVVSQTTCEALCIRAGASCNAFSFRPLRQLCSLYAEPPAGVGASRANNVCSVRRSAIAGGRCSAAFVAGYPITTECSCSAGFQSVPNTPTLVGGVCASCACEPIPTTTTPRCTAFRACRCKEGSLAVKLAVPRPIADGVCLRCACIAESVAAGYSLADESGDESGE